MATARAAIPFLSFFPFFLYFLSFLLPFLILFFLFVSLLVTYEKDLLGYNASLFIYLFIYNVIATYMK